ncbi:MAG: hypothetical protein RL007_628 [Bacteroidota bacterium]|jgi:hypothetical protein
MKNRYSALIALCVLLITAVKVTAQVFSSPMIIGSNETSGSVSSIGTYSSCATVNGNPAVAFYDSTHNNLCFLRANDALGISWGEIQVVDRGHDVGKYASLAIVAGNPAISYYDETFDRLKYIRALDPDGITWGAPVIIEDIAGLKSGYYTNLTVRAGVPTIAFMEYVNKDIKFAIANDIAGNSWTSPFTVVSAGNVGTELSICTASGNPALVYIDNSSGAINFIRALNGAGSLWGTPTAITGTGDIAKHLSVTLIGSLPAVAYYNPIQGTLKFILASSTDGSSWNSANTIDNTVNVGAFPSIANFGSTTLIAYSNYNLDCPRVITSTDGGLTWGSGTDNLAASSGSQHFSAMWAGNYPIYFFAEQIPLHSLNIVRSLDWTGSTWALPVSFTTTRNSGLGVSIANINGHPGAASIDEADNTLYYFSSTDTNGLRWSTPTQVTPPGISTFCADLKVVQGKPAIAWIDAGSGRVYFSMASDSAGTIWPAPVIVDNSGTASRWRVQLDLINGIPVVAYASDGTYIALSYAADPLGTTWNPMNIVLTHHAPSGINFQFKPVGGKPAITYSDDIFRGSYFLMASDPLGGNWLNETTIDTLVIAYDCAAILDLHGKPAVAYPEDNSFTVAYRYALDSLGTSWTTDIFPSPTAIRGERISMELISGRPVISFKGGNMEYGILVATDSIGNNWQSEIYADSSQYSIMMSVPQSSLTNINGRAALGYTVGNEQQAYYSSACITPLPPHSAPAVNICENTSDTLYATGYGTLSWYDAPSGGNYLGSGSPFISPVITANTTFYVQDSTCAASSRTTVMIAARTAPQITATNDTSICPGESVTLSVSGANWYSWSTGDTATSITVSPNVDSTFIVQGTGLNFCSDYDTITVSLFAAIDTAINYNSGVLSSAEPNAQYQWINCTTQQTILGATSQNYTPSANGTYAVIINNGNCIDTSECYNVTDVGINGSSATNVQLNAFYNLSSGRIEFSLMNSTGKVLYEIYSVNGAEVITLEKSGNEPGYFTPNAAGVYIIRATTSTGTTIQRVIAE